MTVEEQWLGVQIALQIDMGAGETDLGMKHIRMPGRETVASCLQRLFKLLTRLAYSSEAQEACSDVVQAIGNIRILALEESLVHLECSLGIFQSLIRLSEGPIGKAEIIEASRNIWMITGENPLTHFESVPLQWKGFARSSKHGPLE